MSAGPVSPRGPQAGHDPDLFALPAMAFVPWLVLSILPLLHAGRRRLPSDQGHPARREGQGR